jgi:hypothetical protein
MTRTIRILALAVVLTAISPVSYAQQAPNEPPKQTVRAKLKQKYLDGRAQFMHRVKDAYFAMGCKVLAREAGMMPLTSSESYLAYVGDQTIVDTKEDEAMRQAAMKEGLDRAARPGECDYYRTHREAAETIRRAAAAAAKQ